ncbi:FAD-linked sulfhydryl oxidase ALR [Halotydeus destructor]|nr:FAD-linked sulfhydryl oxidase ALR [Halotydeus destructor]
MNRSRNYGLDEAAGQSHKVTSSSEKPCRACSDFQTFLKQKGKDVSKVNVNDESPKDCPLDRNQLGRNSWSVLHTIAAYYPAKPTLDQQNDMKSFFSIFSRIYPCEECATDMREDLKAEPPQTKSRQELSQWLCRLHNKVNTKLGKSEFDCSKVDERWLEGWKDGSCG